MKTIEYRVRPVTRYIVTRFEMEQDDLARCSGGSSSKGEFDREDVAEEIALALAHGEPEGRVLFGSGPIYTTVGMPRDLGGGLVAPADVQVSWTRERVIREE
jgi:hypothetical protein